MGKNLFILVTVDLGKGTKGNVKVRLGQDICG